MSIGLRIDPTINAVHVHYSADYKDPEELEYSGEIVAPEFTVPVILSNILKIDDTKAAFPNGTPFAKALVDIRTYAQARELVDIIQNRTRRVTVIVIAGRSAQNLYNAKQLYESLYGKALVCIADYTPDVCNAFLQNGTQFSQGYLYVCHPGASRLGSSRQYQISDVSTCNTLITRLVPLVRRVLTKKADTAVRSIADIKSLIGQSRIRRLRAQLEQANANNDIQLQNSLMAETIQRLELELQKKDAEIKELEEIAESEREDYRKKFNSIEMKYIGQLRRSREAKHLPATLPSTLEDIVCWAEVSLQNLVFTEGAHKTARAYTTFHNLNTAWDILQKMNTVLHRLKFAESNIDLCKAFKDETGYDYARGEGRQTSRNANLARLRRFTFEGQEYEMWTHIKYGNRKNEQLRIYFDFDNINRRVVIGHIGDHMDNATTAKL